MQPTSGSTETTIKLPFAFIFFSLLSFIVSQVLFLIYGAVVIDGTFRLPPIWAIAHLFVLGWMLMLAMGAMYQLVPVAFLTKIWNETFGFVQFVVTTIGVTTFAVTLCVSPQNALIPGILTVVGILMFLFQMGMTLRKQAKPDVITLFVGTALICLLTTITLGILLVISLQTGLFGTVYHDMFLSHLLLGTTGWFTLLIFGFSYKMVPMFSLSHGYPTHYSRYVYGFYISGLISTIGAIIFNQSVLLTIGMLFMFLGFAFFAWNMSLIIKKRMKKKLDRPFIFSLITIAWGAIIHLGAFLAVVFGVFDIAVGPLLFLYLYTWIAFSIIGYLYKIVPFLWWTHKYSKEIGKKDVPVLKDLINEQAAVPVFSFFTIGVILVGIAFIIKNNLLFYVAQTILVIVTTIFAILIVQVIRK